MKRFLKGLLPWLKKVLVGWSLGIAGALLVQAATGSRELAWATATVVPVVYFLFFA
jgi:hypothetical protein